jgi:hypothetical protein
VLTIEPLLEELVIVLLDEVLELLVLLAELSGLLFFGELPPQAVKADSISKQMNRFVCRIGDLHQLFLLKGFNLLWISKFKARWRLKSLIEKYSPLAVKA